MWIILEENKPVNVTFKKELFSDWYDFVISYLSLNTKQNNSFTVISSFENNFFEYHKLTKANKHYAKMCLLVMVEENIDISKIDWGNFFKSSYSDPKKILLMANNHNYRLVREAANFLHEFNPKIEINLNELPNKDYLDGSFNTELFNLFKLESQKKFQYFYLENNKITKRLLSKKENLILEIDTTPLVGWELLNNFFKDDEYIKLYEDLIEQKVIKPSLMVDSEKKESLFEFLMFRSSENNLPVLSKLFFSNTELFNDKLMLEYFNQKLEQVNSLFNLEKMKYPKGMDNYISMLKQVEMFSLNKNLQQNLTNGKEEKGSGKIKV